jgi:CAAX protease family protein
MAINQTDTLSSIRTSIKRHPLLTYFGLTYLLTWLCWVPLVIFLPGGLQPGSTKASAGHPSLLILLFVLGNFVPSIIGIILTRIVEGRGSLRPLFSQVIRWRVNPGWYAIALFLTPLVTAAALALFIALGGSVPASSIVAIAGTALGGAILAPLGEELGWRGFALPRMQAQRTAFGASIVLGLLWGIWHVPRWIWGTTASPTLLIPALVLQVLTIMAFSVLLTWVFNNTGSHPYPNTRGSLLLTMLFHASIAATSYYPFPQQALTASGWEQSLLFLGLLWAVVLVVVVVYGPGRLLRRRASDHIQEASVVPDAAGTSFRPDVHVV